MTAALGSSDAAPVKIILFVVIVTALAVVPALIIKGTLTVAEVTPPPTALPAGTTAIRSMPWAAARSASGPRLTR